MNKLSCLTVAMIWTAMAPPVSAGSITRQQLYQPVTMCQAARPAYEGNLRKRPLAISNEGNASAFVSCGFEARWVGSSFYTVVVNLLNRTASDITVTCTLVDGINGDLQPATYLPKSIVVFAESGGLQQQLIWTSDEDNNGLLFNYPAISCLLPPGVDIGQFQSSYAE